MSTPCYYCESDECNICIHKPEGYEYIEKLQAENSRLTTYIQDLSTKLAAHMTATLNLREEHRQAIRVMDVAQAGRDVAMAENKRLREAIIDCLNNNRHLADGNNCTLIDLKRAIPNWE